MVSDAGNSNVVWSDICDASGTGRSLLGTLIYNVNTMDNYFDANSGFDHQRLLDVTLREFIHLLGMNQLLLSRYVSTATLPSEVYYAHLPAISVLKTPLAVAQAKSHFNCQTMTAIPVVLAGTGSGFNLFSTFLATDIASNYVGVEGIDRQLSAITLAILDDSGWYTVDYSFASESSWGKGKGCPFTSTSCLTKPPFSEFCTQLGSSQCTFDSESIGKCVSIPEDSQCLISMPDQKSTSFPAQKLTCRNPKNNYPWTITTLEVYDFSSACFTSTLYGLAGDRGLRCYTYSCANNQLTVTLDGKPLKCSNTEALTLKDVNGQFNCPSSSQVASLCGDLPIINSAKYCSMKGFLQPSGCICGSGYEGKACEVQVTCDQYCSQCQTSSAIRCSACQDKYTLQDSNLDGVGWCQLTGSACNTNCKTCQNTSEGSCISCDVAKQLAEVDMHDVGYCVDLVVNCSRLLYVANGGVPVCSQCADGYRPLDQACEKKIEKCSTYSAAFCSQCESGFHLNQDKDASKCIKDVANCQDYSDDKLTCKTCASQFQLFDDQICYPTIAFCTAQSKDKCTTCNDNYHWTSSKCLPNIPNCQAYISVDSNTENCKTCIAGFTPNANGCIKVINNCSDYTATSNANTSQCTKCVASYHLGGAGQACYKDVANCQTYTAKGDACSACLSGFDLTIYANCYPTIPNCSARNFMDDTLCATCTNAAYTLSQDQKSCTQPITNCLQATMDKTVIVCSACKTGFHLSASSTECFADIDGCLDYDGKACKTCIKDSILQAGLCYKTILGCDTQQGDECKACSLNWVLVGKLCQQPTQLTPYCKTYANLTNCADCLPGFILDSTNSTTTCFTPVGNCSKNVYDLAKKVANCTECLTNFTLSPDKQKCLSAVPNCTQYTTDRSLCIFCQEGFQLDLKGNQCLPPIDSCLYRSMESPYYCLQCQEGYQIAETGKSCYQCPIEWCSTCTTSQLLGQICSQCAAQFQPNQQRNQCVPLCKVSLGLDNCLTCPITAQPAKCTLCTAGYYLQNSKCLACQDQYAYCTDCILGQCSKCQPGYYYETANSYCYDCPSKYAECNQCDNTKCTECNAGSVLLESLCVTCPSIIPNCQTCAIHEFQQSCLQCQDGFFSDPSQLIECLGCNLKYPNCSLCTANSCTVCTAGFYPDTSGNGCQPCKASCATCSSTACLTCQKNQLLLNGACTQSTDGFKLESSTPSQAQVFSVLQAQTLSNNATYYTIGSLNQRNYFCESDSQCNMNGRCIISQCRCISGLFGSRCQFSNTSTAELTTYQKNLVTYLQGLPKSITIEDLSSRIQIMQSISETALLMTDDQAAAAIVLLQTYEAQLANYSGTSVEPTAFNLLSALGSFSRYFQQSTLVTNSRISSIDDCIDSTIDILAQVTNKQINLPYQRLQVDQYDLKDPKQYANFTATFTKASRMLQANSTYQCNNDLRITQPSIVLTDELIKILKDSQTSAANPLQSELIHFYYNPHINSEGQTVDSAVYRIKFDINQVPVPLTQLTKPIQLIIPKIDQSFSDITTTIKCLTWDEDKQIWDETGIINDQSVNCRFYVVCYTNHLSDFGVQIVKPKPITKGSTATTSIINTDFDFSSIGTNAAFYLSLGWLVIQIVFWIYFCCAARRDESLKRHKDKQRKYKQNKTGQRSPDRSPNNRTPSPGASRVALPVLNTEQMGGSQYQVPLDQYNHSQHSNPATDRGLIEQSQNRMKESTIRRQQELQNMWLIYPFYSIWRGRSTVSVRAQKLSLLLLQLQIYTTCTAGFLSITPFKFGLLTVYFILPIFIAWVSNYLFGLIAICHRKKNGSVYCFYWFVYLFIDLGLFVLSVWCMYDLDYYYDLYLIFGVACQFVIDIVLLDLFVAYIYMSVFEDTGHPVKGCFRIVRFRGFYIDKK